MASSFFRVLLAVAVFAVEHSLIASRQAKDLAARRLGRRQRSGLYRPFYLVQSVLSLLVLWAYIRPLPDRVLYRIRGPLAWLMRLGQAAGLAYATWTAINVGLTRILGIRSLLAWASGQNDVPPEPEAQGPAPAPRGMQATGPFRYHRHPLNFAPLPVFWLNPVMTLKLLAFNLAASVYLYLGSKHEEARLQAAYGRRYRQYQHSGVPFYLP